MNIIEIEIEIEIEKMKMNFNFTLSESLESATDSCVKPERSKSSSSELLALKQLQRLRPHLRGGGWGCGCGCSSMKLWTIFAKQTELGSNSAPPPPPSLLLLLFFGNCFSNAKNLLKRHFDTGSFRTSPVTFSESMSIGWIFNGAIKTLNKNNYSISLYQLYFFWSFKIQKFIIIVTSQNY